MNLSILQLATVALSVLPLYNVVAQYHTPYTTGQLLTRTVDTSKQVGLLTGTSGASNTGGATYTIPIEVTKGTNGVQPNLAFAYNSQAGNGLMGYGWSLSGTSTILRTGQNRYHDGTVKPFNFTDGDRFQLDGQRLVLTSGDYGVPGSTYDTENASFARIELIALAGNDERFWYFEMVTKEGMTLSYGFDWNSKVISGQGDAVVAWRMSRVTDPYGNYMNYIYAPSGGGSAVESPLMEIQYTGNEVTGALPFDKVTFSYQERTDQLIQYSAGQPYRQSKLLSKVEVFNRALLVRRYELSYSWRDDRASYLNEITLYGADGVSSFNATRFAYGQSPSQDHTETTATIDEDSAFEMFTGDFDGNGVSDLVVVTIVTVQGQQFHELLRVYLNGSTSAIPAWSYPLGPMSRVQLFRHRNSSSNSGPQSNLQIVGERSYGLRLDPSKGTEVSAQSHAYDLDGNGRDEILVTQFVYDNDASGGSIALGGWEQVGNGGAWQLESFTRINCEEQNEAVNFSAETPSSPPIGLTYVKSPRKLLEFGDFDADGRIEGVVVFNDINIPNASRTFLFDHEGWHELNVGSNLVTMSTIDLMRAADFDGDGRHELMIFRDFGDLTYRVLNIEEDLELSLTTGGWFNYTYADDDFRLWPADFNGDGITDFLAQTSNGWMTLVGQDHRIPGSQPYLDDPLELDVPFAGSHRIFVADLDGNGLSDILHYYPLNGVWKMRARYGYGMNENGPLFHAPSAFNTQNINSEMIVGDFDGDGRPEVIGSNDQNATVTYTRFNTGAMNRVLEVVSDGHCNSLEYSYHRHRRVGIADQPYPLVSPGSIGLVVDSILPRSNGVLGEYESFSFSEARTHIGGKGFLGFLQTSSTNQDGLTATTTRSLSSTYYTLLDENSHSWLQTTNTDISSTDYDFEQTPYGASNGMGVYTKLIASQATDHLTSATTSTANTWDTYGNITAVQSEVNGGLVVTHSLNVYEAFGPAGIPNRLVSATTTSTRDGEAPVVQTTEHDYDDKGGLIASTVHPNTLMELNTRLDRNTRGSLIKETVSAPSETNGDRITEYNYDPTDRFVVSKTTWWNKNGTMVPIVDKYLYEERWGVPTSHLGPDALTTLWSYDAFGQITQTQIPHIAGSLRHAITHQRNWAISPSTGQTHMLTVSEPGQPRSESYYNALGQTLLERTEVDYTGDWTETRNTYDARGRIIASTEPHKSNEGYFTTTYAYDIFGRKVSETNSFFGTTTVDYGYPGGGDLIVTTSTPDGQVRSSRTDATGVVTEEQDPGGTLKYSYNSRGNVTKVTLNNDIVSLITYDEFGRQTTLMDPNAGLAHYKHDAFGQLVYLRDADNNITTSTYDNLGRRVSRTVPEGTTTWKYFHDGPKVINAPVRIDGPTGSIIFEYSDPYSRLRYKTEIIEGTSYTYRYSYDDNDRLVSLTYPSNLVLSYHYGAIGQLDRIIYNGITLFNDGTRDGGGRYLEYRLGSLPVTTRSYAHGLPIKFNTPGIQHLELKWDENTQNLISRWDRMHNRYEAFEYDELNRLRSGTVSETDPQGQILSEISHHDFGYDGDVGNTKGNLLLKSDIGQLGYYANRAASALNIDYPLPPDQPPFVINLETQTISYTSHHKALRITETIDGVEQDLTYTYGPDQQRRTSTRREQGQLVETRTYVGSYEKQVIDGVTREIHYVQGGDGLCAMLVREDGTTKIYYTFTDHLGSIVNVVEPHGSAWSVVAEQNFDPWGRRRKASTWEHDDVQSGPTWLYRGYTGHEHVEPFLLINMNGRMYDPLNGRMMGADNYVQGTIGTQGFNRYSYAGNNPLKFTDPSGDFIWFVVAGAIAGGYLGGAIAAGEGGISGADWNPFGGDDGKWSGDWWKGSLTGALLGATAGYGTAALVGGKAVSAALATQLGQTVGLSAKQVAISGLSSILRNEGKGWDIWPTLLMAAASPFIADPSVVTSSPIFSGPAFSSASATAAYAFVDRYTNPQIADQKFGSRIGYSLIGVAESVASIMVFGGILSESGVQTSNANLFHHLTTSLPGFNESFLRVGVSILTLNGLGGTIPVDQWYLQQTNKYSRPFDLNRIIQFILNN